MEEARGTRHTERTTRLAPPSCAAGDDPRAPITDAQLRQSFIHRNWLGYGPRSARVRWLAVRSSLVGRAVETTKALDAEEAASLLTVLRGCRDETELLDRVAAAGTAASSAGQSARPPAASQPARRDELGADERLLTIRRAVGRLGDEASPAALAAATGLSERSLRQRSPRLTAAASAATAAERVEELLGVLEVALADLRRVLAEAA